MKKKSIDHVVHKLPDTLACLHCGESYEYTLPAPVDMVASIFKTFMKQHKGCVLGPRGLACSFCVGFGHKPETCPHAAYGGDWRKWAAGPDTGTSSKAIARKLGGGAHDMILAGASAFGNYPHDPDDFGRCHRLLHAIPGWRPRIVEMKDVPGWSKLVAHWDELEALYIEEHPTGSGPKLYKRMQELRDR